MVCWAGRQYTLKKRGHTGFDKELFGAVKKTMMARKATVIYRLRSFSNDILRCNSWRLRDKKMGHPGFQTVIRFFLVWSVTLLRSVKRSLWFCKQWGIPVLRFQKFGMKFWWELGFKTLDRSPRTFSDLKCRRRRRLVKKMLAQFEIYFAKCFKVWHICLMCTFVFQELF